MIQETALELQINADSRRATRLREDESAREESGRRAFLPISFVSDSIRISDFGFLISVLARHCRMDVPNFVSRRAAPLALLLFAMARTTSAQDFSLPDAAVATNESFPILEAFGTNPPPAAPVVAPPAAPTPVVPQSAIVAGPPPAPAPVSPSEQPFRWGPATFHPNVSYRFTYGNGLNSSPGNRRNTIVQRVSPGIGVDLGSVWHLNYTPSLVFYSDPNFRNTLDHSASLAGATVHGDWTLGLSQLCLLTSDPRVETGRQTDRESYDTALNAAYQINASVTLDLGLQQSLNYVGGGYTNSVGSSKTWSTMNWLDYHWGPHISAGAGAGFGYTKVQRGSDTTYEQLQGRVNWRLVQKFTLSLNGGAQILQYVDTSQSDLVNPIGSLSLTYQPFEATTLTLSARWTVNQSTYYANQVTQTRGFIAALTQRLLGRLSLGLSGGYANTRYHSSVPGSSTVSVTRDDDYSFFSANLSTPLLKRGSASIFYSWSSNSSNTGGYGYDSNQVGFQLAYGY